MSSELDDFLAARTIVEALQPFNDLDRERILRWVREKLGMATMPPTTVPGQLPWSGAVPGVTSIDNQ
jgi:hypothetical protein